MKERIKLEFKMNERTNTNERTEKNNERSITNDWEREKQQTDLTNDAAAAKYPITWQK